MCAAVASAAGAGACDRHAPAAAREAGACDVPAAGSAGASEAAVNVAERSCELAQYGRLRSIGAGRDRKY